MAPTTNLGYPHEGPFVLDKTLTDFGTLEIAVEGQGCVVLAQRQVYLLRTPESFKFMIWGLGFEV